MQRPSNNNMSVSHMPHIRKLQAHASHFGSRSERVVESVVKKQNRAGPPRKVSIQFLDPKKPEFSPNHKTTPPIQTPKIHPIHTRSLPTRPTRPGGEPVGGARSSVGISHRSFTEVWPEKCRENHPVRIFIGQTYPQGPRSLPRSFAEVGPGV